MTENKQFGFKSFEISKTDRFLDKLKLYEIDKNHFDDLDESNLFYVYSDSKENIVQLVNRLNELAEENQRLKQSQASTLREFQKGTKKIQQLTKENKKLKLQNEELLYQIGYVGKNNKTCRECECFIPEIKYCYMWDMEVEADDVVVACDQRKVKNVKEMISDD